MYVQATTWKIKERAVAVPRIIRQSYSVPFILYAQRQMAVADVT